MGYLKNIKSPDMYLKMMRALLFRMSEAERDEVCQEVRLHLEALVEDHQAEGHSPQEAMTLAVQQFGPPFKVGGEIARKWEAKRERLVEATQPRLARQKKWHKFIFAPLVNSVPILFVLNYHSWPLILAAASIHGLLSGVLLHYTGRLDAQIAAAGGPLELCDWRTAHESWKKTLPQVAQHRRQKKNLWGGINLYVIRWLGSRFLEGEESKRAVSSAFKWKVIWQLLGFAYLTALVLWPAEGNIMNMKNMMIFLYVSLKMAPLSRSLADKLLPAAQH